MRPGGFIIAALAGAAGLLIAHKLFKHTEQASNDLADGVWGDWPSITFDFRDGFEVVSFSGARILPFVSGAEDCGGGLCACAAPAIVDVFLTSFHDETDSPEGQRYHG